MQRVAAAVLSLLLVSTAHSQSQSCESLAQATLPQAKVVSAKTIPFGAYPVPNLPPGMSGVATLFKSLPAFCRVEVTGKPSADSDIKIEVWMPVVGWNARFQGQGNGGFAGDIAYVNMAIAVLHGYATASTNTGHTGQATDASWALGHPEKITDFGYRGIHQMTESAKL